MAGDENKDKKEEEESQQLQPADSEDESTEDEGDDSPIPEEVLESMPKDQRTIMRRAFASLTQVAGPVFNPIYRKITPEHITKMIEHVEAESTRFDKTQASERKYSFAYFLVGLGAVLALVILFGLRENTDILAPIITGVLGFAGGFGIGKWKR